jgi:hypothetical protein
VNGFYVFVKIEMGFYSALFQGIKHNLLLIWRQDYLSTSAHEILIASEVQDEHIHELRILLREHTFLEVGEASGKPYWLGTGIMGTIVLHGTQ